MNRYHFEVINHEFRRIQSVSFRTESEAVEHGINLYRELNSHADEFPDRYLTVVDRLDKDTFKVGANIIKKDGRTPRFSTPVIIRRMKNDEE